MMIEENEIANCLEMMKDSLVKKDKILDSLIALTAEQEKVLAAEVFDDEAFEKTINAKSPLIEEINKLDEGFNLTYKRVIGSVKERPGLYRDKIEAMQGLIKALVEKGLDIEKREGRNKIKFDLATSKGREKIKKYNLSSSAATKYYSNMTGNVGTGNYFLDSKK